MSEILCLICCYQLQEKRIRVISDGAKEALAKFCDELGCSKSDRNKLCSRKRKIVSEDEALGSECLGLPFGENVSVCGDCLSLIVLYIRGKTVQKGKEEKLLELQKAVCVAIKELSNAVQEVQCQVNLLHKAITMGSESTLKKVYGKTGSAEDKENTPWSFRAKILKLNVVGIRFSKLGENVRPQDGPRSQESPINIKIEPIANNEEEDFDICNQDQSIEEDGDYDDSFYPDAEENQPDLEETNDYQIPEVVSTTTTSSKAKSSNVAPKGRNTSFLKRARRRTVTKCEYKEEDSSGPEGFDGNISDFDNQETSNLVDDSDDVESNYSDQEEVKPKPKRKARGRGRPKKIKSISSSGAKELKKIKTKSERSIIGFNLNELEKATQQWKDDLFGRVVMQMNNDINESSSNSQQNENVNVMDDLSLDTSNSYQLINGELKLRGVVVKILENSRALQCGRCGKRFFEERDVPNDDVQLENLMRDHILTKHCGVIKKAQRPSQPIEVQTFTSHTRNKITYKLACSRKYTYCRKAKNKNTGGQYFRCDYIMGNCGASILYEDGVYKRLVRGWNPDGTHTVHAPDVERTNQQIALAKAKEMFVQNSTKSIDEVCNEIISQSDGQLKMSSMEGLRRQLLYAKYQTRRMPQEEKLKRCFRCPECSQVYKEQRCLTRHIKRVHEFPSTGIRGTSSKKPTLRKTSALKKTKKQKTDTKQTESASASAEGPSIVFDDPSVANNFVNKCISAIMQQVGLSVSGNSTAPKPRTQQENIASTSVSPAPSDISQHDNVPNPQLIPGHNQSRAGNSSSFGQMPSSAPWQQPPSSSQHGAHQGQFPTTSNHSSNTNQHVSSWPWNTH